MNKKLLSSIPFKLEDFKSKGSFIENKKNKKRIRAILKNHFGYDSFGIDNISSTDEKTLNAAIQLIKNKLEFNFLFNMFNGRGLGPGEIMLYYLIDDFFIYEHDEYDAIDSKSTKIEIKSVRHRQETKEYNDFRIKQSINPSAVIKQLRNLTGTMGDVPTSDIKKLKMSNPEEYEKIRQEYIKSALPYFKNKTVLLINKRKMEIAYINSSIQSSDIDIDRISSGVLRPTLREKK